MSEFNVGDRVFSPLFEDTIFRGTVVRKSVYDTDGWRYYVQADES